MKKLFISITFFGFFSLMNSAAWAQAEEAGMERNPAQFVQDRDIMEKIKSHDYKGGAEEGELRVQAQLPKAQRKIAPVIDRHEIEKDNQDHD